MEIKKLTRATLKVIILLVFLILVLFGGDITQYKQIGTTSFLLLETPSGNGAHLYHDGGEKKDGVLYPVITKTLICDVLWNRQYIIAMCSRSGQHPIEGWYILKNMKEYDYKEFYIREFLNENDYQTALDSLGMEERDMVHTDGRIPWRLHLFK